MKRGAAIFAILLAGLQGAASAAPVSDFKEFARPHEAVAIDGNRHLNLFCLGDGKTIVLFDAGGSDWSVVWALVQPRLGPSITACSYDRAGLGYSQPAKGARTPAAIVQDAHALITRRFKHPVVLVGHSLGGFNVKLHAALYPDDVAGLVLLDPSEERDWDRTRGQLRARFGRSLTARAEFADLAFAARLMAHYRDCAAETPASGLDPESEQYRRCTDRPKPRLGPSIAAERQRLQVTANYQEAQASEILNSVYGTPELRGAYAGLFPPGMLGNKPVTVLTHGTYDREDPVEALGQAQGIAVHRQTAALSRKGRHRVVPLSGHYIQLDAPEAVIAAIHEVVAQVVRAR